MENVIVTIFGEGDGTSLKSRIKGTEDALTGLKELVLENRKEVKDNLLGLKKSLEGKLENIEEVSSRINDLEKLSWFPKMLDMSLHKLVAVILGAIFIMALTNMGVWAVSKGLMFKEKPTQQQEIYLLLEKILASKQAVIPPKEPHHLEGEK